LNPQEAIFLKRTHPELTQTTVRCSACERTFVTRSTRDEIVVDVCSNCHPAYTGAERTIHTGSRTERFERRRAASRRPAAA
jgi:large subunit ribosomal protein L31